MDNRGSLLDLPVILVFFFIFALTIVLGYKIITEIQTGIQITSGINETESVTHIVEKGRSAQLSFDGLFVFAFIGSCISVFIGAFMLGSHPIFFAFSIFFFGIITVLAVIFSNVYVEVASTTEFASSELMFPMIGSLVRNLPIVMILMAFALVIIMFGKSYTGSLYER